MAKVSEDLVRERQFLKRKIKALGTEYHAKVTYDFSRYIYVGVKQGLKLGLEEAIALITTCAGYEAHRVVVYKNILVTNLYVRFVDESYATAAAERLFRQEGYCVDMVGAMLLYWYLEEMLKGNFPWTLAVVSIEGRPEHPNSLSEDALQSMLMEFGDPKINTYQNGNQIEHVQVLFSSMSEALGACIAHGRWFAGNVLENAGSYYKIQLMGSEKEVTLLRAIQSKKPESDQELEALELDYFVQKMEIKTSYREENSYVPSSLSPTTSHDSRNSLRFSRGFRRQFTRGRGNSGRGKTENSRGQYENRNNSRRFPFYNNQTFPHQVFTNFQTGVNLPA